MHLVIHPDGTIRCVYSETIDLEQLGTLSIRRGSYVEPDHEGRWLVDLAPCGGLVLGPFHQRSAALAAEQAWLTAHWLMEPADATPSGNDRLARAIIA